MLPNKETDQKKGMKRDQYKIEQLRLRYFGGHSNGFGAQIFGGLSVDVNCQLLLTTNVFWCLVSD